MVAKELLMPTRLIHRYVNSSPAGLRCVNRIIEWMATLMLLNTAATLLVWPDTLEAGAFKYLLAMGFAPGMFGSALLSITIFRVFALIFNGRRLPWSARVRAFGAMVGVYVFAHLAFALFVLTMKETGEPSISIGTYALLACGELFSCLRAGADVNEKPYSEPTAVKTVIVHSDSNLDNGHSEIVDAVSKRSDIAT
jgi:hypothetical protein